MQVPRWIKVLVLNFMARMIHCQCGAPRKDRDRRKKKKLNKQAQRLAQDNAEVCLRLVNECHLNKRSPVAEFRANKMNIGNSVAHNARHGNCNPGHEYHRHDKEYNTTSFIESAANHPDVKRLTVMEEILKYLKVMVAKRDEDDQEAEVVNEWQQVAMVMDRFLFWTFLGCTVLATVVMMVIIPVVRSYTAMEQGQGI